MAKSIGRFRVVVALLMIVCTMADFSSSLASAAEILLTLSKSAPKSVLAALMESPQSNFMELVERARLLERLESSIGQHNLTIFAPGIDFWEQHLDTGFKSFLTAPSNVDELQKVVLSHVIPRRISSSAWKNGDISSLDDPLHLGWARNRKIAVNGTAIDFPDMIVRSDGIVHGINGVLVPKSVENAYAAFRLKTTPPAIRPTGAPQPENPDSSPKTRPQKLGFIRQSDRPSEVAPACAPSQSMGDDVEGLVEDFIGALTNYGDYKEIAALMVNLTSLASEMGKLVSEGHKLTFLAPNDQAVDRLTTNHLNAPGGIEGILTYHILAEYQTEESLYTSAKLNRRIHFTTLRSPLKLVAQEIDGTVQFGNGKWSGLLLDPNIFLDGRISVQGINNVLLPPQVISGGRKLLTREYSRG